MAKRIRKQFWDDLWRRFDDWYSLATQVRGSGRVTWRDQQDTIKKYVQCVGRNCNKLALTDDPPAVKLNWRRIWEKFNEFCKDHAGKGKGDALGDQWDRQKDELARLVRKEINK